MLRNHQLGAACSRRSFIQGAAAAGISIAHGGGSTFAARRSPRRIRQVVPDLDHIHKWDNSNGDTWDPFWADDDNLYAFNCDGRGFGIEHRNLSFNKLAGNTVGALIGSSMNSMDAYGRGGFKGPDGATWKACGQECIDGVFYAFVSRNTYGGESRDPLLRQTAVNSSLIQSTDRGLTWMRSADENYNRPMWPGPAFGAPFFIHYGRNGGGVTRDGADRYVYASSTNGFWNDGDSYILGRIERNKLPALDSSDWSYYTGGDGAHARNWSRAIGDAKPVFSAPAHCGQGPICYISTLDLYLLIAWYNTEKMTKWFEPTRMRYDYYQAEHPWGPWTFINSYSDSFISSGHMYGPSLCAKFQDGPGSEVRVIMFTSGCPFQDIPSGLYKMWEIPLILRTEPAPAAETVYADDPRVVFRRAWNSGGASLPSLNPHARYTNANGASAELKFEGKGIVFITEKGPEFGGAQVWLDGRRTDLDLLTPNFPRILSVQAFAASELDNGAHSIRVVNAGERRLAIESFEVMR